MELEKKTAETDGVASARAEAAPASPAGGGGPWRVVAVAGMLLAAAAWGMLFFAPLWAAVTAVTSLLASSLGLKCGRGCLRDLAVTAIIASAVLIVVFSIFYWGVPYAIDKL